MPAEVLLRFSEHIFEYDIYSLVKAFWPAAELIIRYDGDAEPEGADAAVQFRFFYGEPDVQERTVVCQFRCGDPETAKQLGLAGTVSEERAVRIPDWDDRRGTKDRVKQLVYGLLRDLTGRELPWGDLTGIRPVKLVSGLLRQGYADEAILRYMRKTWFVSGPKARLALETAKREEEILAQLHPESGWSLYIGIPFCPSICLY